MGGPVRSWIEKLYRVFGDADKVKGIYVPSRRAIRTLPENETLFGETLISWRRTKISINSAYGVSRLRQISTTTGSATIDDTSVRGKILLTTGTTAGSTAKLESSEVGIYAPGFAAEVGIGVRTPQTLSGTAVARWGGISVDNENGFYFKEWANDQLAAVRRKDDVEVDVVERANWNIDPLDGTGASKINIQSITGYIWQIDFSWYGYGLIVYGIVRQMADFQEVQHFIPCHVIQITNDISVSEPNLQIFADIDNGDQVANYQLDIGGMQYSVLGDNDGVRQRTVDDYVSDVTVDNTSDTHLITFERVPGLLNRSFMLDQINTVVSGDRVIFEVWLDGIVTLGSGVTYETPTGYTSSETSIETVREQTFDRTGAVLLFRTSTEAGGGNKAGEAGSGFIDLNLPANATITVTARTEAASATVDWCLVRGREGW